MPSSVVTPSELDTEATKLLAEECCGRKLRLLLCSKILVGRTQPL